MTREEALKYLKDFKDSYWDGMPEEALDMAIQALSQEPCRYWQNGKCNGNTEVCDDAISRDMALEKMADYVASGYADSAKDFEEYSRIICQLPSVTQKSGKWINDECGNVICSECKRFRRDCRFGHTNYCNHCGAKMEREEISERNMKMWEEIFKAERSGK